MSKKSLVLLTLTAFTLSLGLGVSMSLANKGPAEITLNPDNRDGQKKGKPAFFPHAMHQEKNDCSVCHHKDDGGKQAPLVAGDEFAKCGSCHNADFAGEKLRKWKDIGHGLCKSCHTKKKAEGAPTKCTACHPRK